MHEATMDIPVYVFSGQNDSFHLTVYIGVEFLGHWVNISLALRDNAKMFSKAVVLITILSIVNVNFRAH